ncbi:MATE family efflux transporter [Apibacter muscae]|uniref:Multidrug-efflux transporter n=1 Tax=Apibacter muscae TaxID=2509004 RepID=A0A563D851_9FLAO|nr:MATE family efflux transporter [Apibacter muscae]TWP22925.1 MATE family efflux transporter [Apibacter muscae]TWP26193.1 MATE family efflux transporter [Apibacter muscae]
MTIKEHFKANSKLAIPVLITQLGQVSVNFIDIIIIAGLGEKAVASASLATSVFIVFLVFLLGFSFSMSPLISSSVARGNNERVGRIFTHGFTMNVLLALISIAILEIGSPLLYYTKQDPSVIPDAIRFLNISAYSLLPLMIFQSYRQFSEGISMTILVTIATIISNITNIILNFGLIYGKWGLPNMGVEGSAMATLIARILMMLIIITVLHINKKSAFYLNMIQWKSLKAVYYRKLISIGLPSSLQSLFEICSFAISAFIAGAGINKYLDTSAHSVTTNLASMTFQICMGFGIAATVRVAGFYGLKNRIDLRKAGLTNLYLVIAFMTFAGIIFVTFRNYIPLIYFKKEQVEVIKLASHLIIIAAIFQIFDGIQVVMLGALRGMRDVKIPTIICFIAYIIIAIPIGYYLCIEKKMGAFGMWIGLCLGLIFASILLLLRFNTLTRKNSDF